MSKQCTFPSENLIVKSWILFGETENMSYSMNLWPTHQERGWAITDAQCLSKSPVITWQSCMLA